MISVAFGQGTLTYQNIPTGPYGPGSSIAVLFKPNGPFPIGSRFNLILSDASGNFTASSPRIGTINSHYTTFINGVIPVGTTASSNYKLRVDVLKPDGTYAISENIPGLTITIQAGNGTNGTTGTGNSGTFLETTDVGNTNYLINDSLKYYAFSNCLPDTVTRLYLRNRTNFTVNWSIKNEFDFTNITQGPSFSSDAFAVSGTVNANARIMLSNFPKRVHYRIFQTITDPTTNTISTKAIYFINNQLSSPFSAVSAIVCYDPGSSGDFYFKVDIDSTKEGSTFFNFPAAIYKANWDNGTTSDFSVQEIIAKAGLLRYSYSTSSCNKTVVTSNKTFYNSFGPSLTAFHVTNCTLNPAPSITPVQIFPKPKFEFTSPDKACLNTNVTFTNTSILGEQGSQDVSGCAPPNITYKWLVDGDSVGISRDLVYRFTTPGVHQVTLFPVIPPGTVLACRPQAFSKDICIESVPPNTAKFGLVSIDNNRNQDTSFCPSNAPFTVFNQSGTLSNGTFCSPLEYIWDLTGPAGFTAVRKTGSQADPNFTFPTVTIPGEYTLSLIIKNPCGQSQAFLRKLTVVALPAITAQPTNKTVCEGFNTSFTVTATGGSPTYVWKVSTNGGTSFTTVTNGGVYAGATTNTLTITGATLSMNGYRYQVEVSGTCPPMVPSTVVTLTVNPTPTVAAINNQTVCAEGSTTAVTFTGTVSGTVFNWVNSNINIGLAANGNGNINVFTAKNATNAPISGEITVTPTANGCTGTAQKFTITVNPRPFISNKTQTICSGTAFSVAPLNSGSDIVPTGTTYTWSAPNVTGIDGEAAGNGETSIGGTLTNTTNAPINVVYTVTPTSPTGSCQGPTFTVTVTVNPRPAIQDKPATVCSGISFSVTPSNSGSEIVPAGTVYSWDAPNVTGIDGEAAGSGSTNISGQLTNTTSAPIVVTYVVTPRYTNSGVTCSGTPFNVNVTVNPTPTVATIANQAYCAGALTTITTFSGTVTGTTYSWTNSNAAIGLGLTGTGDIPSFTTTNAGSTAISGTISVTPTANGCSGTARTFILTVNPKAAIQNKSTAACSGVGFNVTPSNGVNGDVVPSGTTYSWSAPSVTGITGAQAGSGATSISGTLTNTTSAPISVIYTVTPLSGTCSGPSFTVTVVVNPKPAINNFAPTVCSGDLVTISPTDATDGIVPTGTTYTWSAPTVVGVTNITAGTGAASFSQTLTNTTNTPKVVTYSVRPTSPAGTCDGLAFTVTITVNPRPRIANKVATAICSGGTFTFTPVNGAGTDIVPSGTTYSWSAPSVTGITGTAGSSAGATSIEGTLTNTTNAPITVEYTVTPTSGNCSGATFKVSVTVNPRPSIQDKTEIVCSGLSFAVTPSNVGSDIVPAGTTYTWSAPNVAGITGEAAGSGVTSIGGTLTNTTNAPISVVYDVTPTSPAGTCAGTAFKVTVTVNPRPQVANISTVSCSGNLFTVTPTDGSGNILPAGTTFSWSAPTVSGITGLASGSAASSISGTLTNTTNAPISVPYSVTPLSGSCGGSVFTVTVTVNPRPAISNKTTSSCSGSTFTVTPSNSGSEIVPNGTTYSWTAPIVTGITGTANSTAGATSISGNLINTTTSSIDVTYTVTPTYTSNGVSCSGSNFTVTVTVHPTPTVSAITSQVICKDGSSTAVNFSGTVSGTTYSWTNTNAAIGLAVSGTGNIASFTGTNTTNAPISGTITVTPTANTCSGSTQSFTITVNPKPTISAQSTAVCSGNQFTFIPANGSGNIVPTGTNYSWAASNVTGISGISSGTGTSITGTLTNTTNAPIDVAYTVTPTFTSGGEQCSGSSFTLTVTVNPRPAIADKTLAACSGDQFTLTPSSGTDIVPSGTRYSWGAPSVANITGANSGTGVLSFSGTLTNTTSSPILVDYTLTPLSPTGSCTGQTFKVSVTVNPKPFVRTQNTTICTGEQFSVTPTDGGGNILPTGTTYSWNAPTVTGITGTQSGSGASSISGTLTNTTSSPITVNYTVTPLSPIGSCQGAPFTVSVIVNPGPVISNKNIESCSATPFSVTPGVATGDVAPVGTVYTWTAPTASGVTGMANSSPGATSISGTLTNNTNAPIDVAYLVTPSFTNGGATCTGSPFTVTVKVNPTPTVASVSNQIKCKDDQTTAVTFSGTVSGTTFAWTNTNSAIGLAASGTGNIAAFTATNTTNAAITGTITVTPTANSCSGAQQSFTITVNPKPAIGPQTAITCSGTAFTSTPSNGSGNIVPVGISYSWTAAPVTGISGISTGSGTSITGTLTNSTSAAINVVYTVTPSFTSGGVTCSGNAFTLTVTVNPRPFIQTEQKTVCSGILFTATPVDGNGNIVPAGITYSWSAPVVTGITGTAAGSGATSISGTLTNTTNAPITVNYQVTPLSGNCSGTPFTVSVVVDPRPSIPNQVQPVCSEQSFTLTPTNGGTTIVPAGTRYSWNAPTVAGITGAAAGTNETTINGTLTNTTNAPILVDYIVTPISGNCTGATFRVSVTVNPRPAILDQSTTVCSGTSFTVTPTNVSGNLVPSGTRYAWSAPVVTGISGTAGGSNQTSITGNITNNTNAPIDVEYTVTPSSAGCNGLPFNVKVTVNPRPSILPKSTIVCSGDQFTVSPTSGVGGDIVPSGTTYTWAAPNVIGITGAAAGTAASFVSGTLTNTTNAPITVTYSVTPNSPTGPCSGAPFDVTVTVNPRPSIVNKSRTLCSGDAFSFTPVNGAGGDLVPAGTTYSWSAPNVAGISNAAGASGATNISGALTNTTNAPITVVYTVTPLYTNGSCSGSTFTVTITVNPRPSIQPKSTSVCSGDPFTVTPNNVSGDIVPSGTTYTWTAPTVTGISGTAAGTNASTISGTLVNNTSAPINVEYTVSPNSPTGPCSGPSFKVTVTVRPRPRLSSAPPAPVCSGSTFSYTPTSNVTAATSFSWSRAAITGISNTANTGTGSISEVLQNITTEPIVVTYVITMLADGCSNTENIQVTVNPIPAFTGVLNPAAICSGAEFNYTPASSTTGATFSWSRAVVGGISNTAATGVGPIRETLTNTTPAGVNVTYEYTVTANGCTNPVRSSVVVNVKPAPKLSSTLTPNPICNSVTFNYTPTSATTGVSFVWTRAAITGINNGLSGSGTNNIQEVLTNSTVNPIDVRYTYSLTANGCTSTETVTVRVNPTPQLSTTLSPSAICSGDQFIYTAASATSGTTFRWSRAAITGIANPAISNQNTGIINEFLTNNTADPIDVVYVVEMTANNCTNTQNVIVRVNPIPQLSSTLTPNAICSETNFAYTPQSATAGTTFTWSRAAITGISNAARTNISGAVSEVLTNTTANPIDVIYKFTIRANNCTNIQDVVVRVNPKPVLTSGTTAAPVCSGEPFTYNPTSATSNVQFSWSRPFVNGISNSAGSGTGLVSETLINITPNPITVTYVYTLSANSCNNVQNVTVVVNPTPVLTSTLRPSALCNNATFRYTPVSSTAGATFRWTRAAVSGISNSSASGTGAVNEVLENTTTDPLDVTYIYAVEANGCTNPNSFAVVVTINPTPRLFSTLTPNPICSRERFEYTPSSLTAGATYSWTRPSLAGVNNGVSSSGTGAVSEILTNNTPNPIDVRYNYRITANNCSFDQVVTVRLNPIPVLNSTLTPNGICSGSSFIYNPTSLTSGVVFTWERRTINGISNPPTTGTGNINEVLTNTTTEPIDVVYAITLAANGCSFTQNVTVRVSPIPTLTSSLKPADICSETAFAYSVTSGTTNVQFTWTRPAIAGISNPTANGTGNINEILTNTTPAPIDVTYTYTLRANGCENRQDVVVRVNPKPVLTSLLNPPPVCSETTFNYTATSATAGVAFTWTRSTIPGISNTAATGGSIINETLVNTTPNPINVTYEFTMTANGCTNKQNVVVRVNPKPLLTTQLVLTPQCSGTMVSYSPSSATAGTAFTWVRNSISGISNAPANGTGAINEVLTNTTGNPIDVVYLYTLTANNCSNTQRVSIIIDPLPVANFVKGALVSCGPLVKSFENISTVNGTALTNGKFTWEIYVEGKTAPILTLPSVTYYDKLDFRFTNTGVVDSVYEVVLTAISPNGCVNTIKQKFTINPDARAYFDVVKDVACANFDVMANNNVAAVAYGFANNQTSYRWTIMNKNRQVIRAANSFAPPAHIMTNDDDTNYIKLEVDSRWGCKSSSYERMVRTFENPTVNFSVNVMEGCTPLSTTVSNNSFLGPTRNVSALSYRWFLNGSFASGNRNDIFSLRNNSFTTDSLINIKLVVSENINGCRDSLTVGPVRVFPKPSPRFLILKDDPECSEFGGIERSIDDLSVYKMNPPATTKYLWSAQYQSGSQARSVVIDSTDLQKPKFRFPDNKSFFDTVYTLKLKLISVDRCEDSITNTIKVHKRPNVQFTLPIDTGCGSNNIVPLDFTNNFREDSLIRNWTVVPADGVLISDPTVKAPEFIFPVNNTDRVIVYTLRQSVRSLVGCEDVLSRTFSVYPLPEAKFTTGNADKLDSCGAWTKTFHNQSDPKNGGLLNDRRVLFKWTIFKDGKQIFATANETTRNRLTYTFTNTGVVDSIYTVKLWIQSVHGCLDSISRSYTVHPNPKAFFDGDTTGCAPFNLREHIKVKDFPFANDLYGYEWRIYDRFGFLLARRDSIDVPDYTMLAEGDTIRLQLIAKSPYGCRNNLFDRLIITQPKSVKADFSVSATSYCADATVKFINKSYLGTPDQTAGLNYRWFMNGNLIGTNRDTTLVLPNLSHVKDTTYNFKLFVNYSIYGCTDSFPASVTVRPRPQVIMSVSGTDTCGSPVGVTKEIKDLSLIKPGAVLKTWSLTNEGTGKKLGLPFPVNGGLSTYTIKFGDNKGDIDSVYTIALRLQSVDGCVADTSYKVVLFRRPNVKFGFDKPMVCGQEMVVVQDSTKNVDHTKFWSYETFQGDPIQIITPSSKNPSIITPSNTRNNEVYYFIKQVATTVNGCVDSATATLTARPIPIAKFKPERDTSCSGVLDAKFIDLSYTQTPGTSIQKWSWKFDDGNIDTVSRNPSHKFNTPGRFFVSLVVRDNQGCASDPFVSPITVYGAPTTSFLFPKSDQHCIIDTLKPVSRTIFGFGSSKVTSYKWDFGDPTQNINELNKEFPRHMYTKPGAYKVTLSITTDSSCVAASFEDSVYIVGKPVAGFYSVNSCVGVPVNFTDTSKAGLYDNIGRYFWDFGDGRTSTARNPSHTYLKSGTFTVRQMVFGAYCVTQSDTTLPGFKLDVYDRRKDSTYPRLHLPYNIPTVICADPGHVSYTWTPRGDLDFTNIPCPEIKVTRPSITYNIRIVDTSGCIINDKQEVWGFAQSDVFLPRAFIPNNPVMTENKILRPVYVGIKELKSFRVFDRFGHQVFGTNDMSKYWDGTTNNGKLSPTETYTWIIVAIDTQGKQIIRKGNVTLIRN